MTQKLTCEPTVRDGKVVYDLNAMTRDRWDTVAPGKPGGDPRWDGISPRAPRCEDRAGSSNNGLNVEDDRGLG